jgi:hypothetical protein
MRILAAVVSIGLAGGDLSHHQVAGEHSLSNFLISIDPRLGNCTDARPVLMLSNNEEEPDIFQHDFFPIDDIASNFSNPIVTVPGWINITIADVLFPFNKYAPYPCSHGHSVSYTPIKCKEKTAPGRSRNFFNGSNGYDLRIVQNNQRSILWAPVRDHHNGVYTARVRVQDPGSYQIELRQNDKNGCHLADCDNPLCEAVFKHNNREHYCKGETQPCVRLVANRSLTILQPATTDSKNDHSTLLPKCSLSAIGTAPGRWIEPVHQKGLNNSELFGEDSWPYVWQPYDCSLSWMSKEKMKECNKDKEMVFIGMSRERTNFFDVLDFQGIPVNYRQVQHADSCENLNYISVYFSQLKDMKEWNNPDDKLSNIKESIRTELGDLPICRTNFTETTGRDVHVYLTIDSIIVMEQMISDKWEHLLVTYFDSVQAACPKAVIHYSTSIAVASQYGALSWQRMHKVNEMGIAIAHSRNISVINSFAMTQPLTPEPEVYRDTVHLYGKTKLVGNYVSKTVTMLMMRQACPNL